MPSVREQFKTYHDFATAGVDDLFGGKLASAYRREVNRAESGIFINDGKGRFKFRPLPRIAQISPVFGSAVSDVNGDGIPDLILAQNFFHPQIETRKMNAGLSLLLLGVGDGSFEPVSPAKSGIVNQGDSRSLTLADFNGDQRPDFVIGRNNDSPQFYLNQSTEKFIGIRLLGDNDKPHVVGARVTLLHANGSQEAVEIHAGSGFLSQSSATIFHGSPVDNPLVKISVRWPDGRETKRADLGAESLIRIKRP